MADAMAILSQPIPRPCSNEKAVEYANYLGRAMPTGQGTDFDIWVNDAALIFCEYPERDVKLAVEHPAKGLRAAHKWLPTPSDIIAYLADLTLRRGRILANAREIVKQHNEDEAERKLEAEIAKTTPEQRLAKVKELLGRFV
jgi:hypothetical protein